jgi:hypothetical protein
LEILNHLRNLDSKLPKRRAKAVRKKIWEIKGLIVPLVILCLGLGVASTSHAYRDYRDYRDSPDPYYCDHYARDYANRYDSGGRDVVGGALGGAAGGALIGGIIGGGRGAGQGAAIGAGVGAVGGGAHAAQSWNYNYRRAYDACMDGRY